MAGPERKISNPEQPTHTKYEVQLLEIDRQLEIADESENTIERTAKREQLLEMRDAIEAETSMNNTTHINVPNPKSDLD